MGCTSTYIFRVFLLVLLTNVIASEDESANLSGGIGLLHMHDNAPFYRELGELSFTNKRRYTARHGYDLISHTPAGTKGLWQKVECKDKQEGMEIRGGQCYIPHRSEYKNDARAATFGKIKLAKAACVGRDNWWLLWSDADAVIVNQTIKLQDIIDDRFDMMVTVDWLMLNAGVFLMKCSPWYLNFLEEVYKKRSFDEAKALDQSSFQWHIDNIKDAKNHVQYVPKWVLNVYPEEYRPGDFLVHLAGKLYEATPAGVTALARQFDVFGQVDDIKGIAAFFSTRYILNKYSGMCMILEEEYGRECKPEDDHRLKLDERLLDFSSPNRYRHVGMRYYWLKQWKDQYDVPDWNKGRKPYMPKRGGSAPNTFQEGINAEGGNSSDDAACEQESCKDSNILKSHDEL